MLTKAPHTTPVGYRAGENVGLPFFMKHFCFSAPARRSMRPRRGSSTARLALGKAERSGVNPAGVEIVVVPPTSVVVVLNVVVEVTTVC
jgi:hypothetical protein